MAATIIPTQCRPPSITAAATPQVPKSKPPLCDQGREWRVPSEGLLEVEFVAEPMPPAADEEVCSDAGAEAFLEHLERLPSDDERLRLERFLGWPGCLASARSLAAAAAASSSLRDGGRERLAA